MHNGFLTYRKK